MLNSYRNGVPLLPPRPIRYDALNVSSSLMDMPLPIFWGQRRLSTNAIDYGDFQHHSIDKAKGGGAKAQQPYDYTAYTILALGEGPIDSIARSWAAGSTTTTSTLSQLNQTFFSGTATQSPWSWILSNFPTKARAYALTAYLASPKQDLGESATIPDNAYECVRQRGFAYAHTTAGWIDPNSHTQYSAIDVLLSDCTTDLLTSVQYGALCSSGDLGDMTQWASYMRAQGLFFSPLLNQPEKANDVLTRWAQLSNSWIYWSGAQYQFVPLGDEAVTANGATYTPVQDVAYDLGLGNFIFDKNSPPVKVSRKDPADCANRTVVNITDRTIGYTANPKEYKNQTLVDLYGLRDNANIQADEICDPPVGVIVAQLIGKRAAYIRKTYQFKTSYRYVLALPGTILTLTEPNLGLSLERVRVTRVRRNQQRQLEFEAEEFPGTVGTYYAPLASASANVPSTPNLYVDPGPVNTPAIVEPSSAFSSTPKLLIAASGGANWGGCTVSISFDGTSYSQIGKITAGAPQGLLTASLPSHADPDTTDTLAVDCTESQTVPTPVTTADADALRTLALVCAQPTVSGGVATLPTNGELLAFGDVTATGTYTANLTYLRRGALGTSPAAHSTGDQFTVLDVLGQTGSTLAYALPAAYVGKTLYFKFASFNAFGNATEDLSTVQEYAYTPTGAGSGAGAGGKPSQPTGLSVSTAGAASWTANPSTDNVTSYTLWRAAGLGASFASASAIWSGDATSDLDSTAVAGSSYTYFVTANNAAGASAASTGFDVTIAASGYDPAGSAATAQSNAEAYTDARIVAPCTVAALPTPTSTESAHGLVTDATVAFSGSALGTAPAGGGSNIVPVYWTGSQWLIG